MTQEPADPAADPLPANASPASDDEPVKVVLARVIADARAYAAAEAERQKLRAGIVGAGVRDAAIFGVIALMLVFAAIVALLVGLVIVLTPLIGAGWGTFAVVAGGLLLAVALLLLAKSRIGRMIKAIRP